MITSLLVKGAFTEDDLQRLLDTLRLIERRQHNLPFTLAVIEADLSIEQAEEVIRRTFPRVNGREPVMQTIIKVICPDGHIRPMMPATDKIVPDDAHNAMVQGSVEINGITIHGEAWRKNEQYHFSPLHT